MKIGFTGTRHGLTTEQRATLAQALRGTAGEFHHGDCVGADAEAHAIAADLDFLTVVHPPSDEQLRAFCDADRTEPARPYLKRNRDIVRSVDLMIAAPGGMEEQHRSGTWSTVRFARQLGTPVLLIMPDGSTDGATASGPAPQAPRSL